MEQMKQNKHRSKTTGDMDQDSSKIIEHEDDSKTQKSLLDLVEYDERAKIWQGVLTSIIELNKNFEKVLENEKDALTLEKILASKGLINEYAKEKTNFELEQLIFSQAADHKTALLKLSGESVKTSSRDEKRNFFLERSIKFEGKLDKTYNLKVTSHADKLFYLQRMNDGIDQTALYECLDLEKNFELKVNDSKALLGKSSASFFFSHDDRLVLKSIDTNNYESFSEILPNYFEYILREQDSLQSRIYGLYKIEEDVLTKRYFVLMENIFEDINRHIPLKIYDLKGSTHERSTKEFKPKCDEQNAKVKEFLGDKMELLPLLDPNEVKKYIKTVGGRDVDFTDSEDSLIKVKKDEKVKIMKAIENDTNFFTKNNLMDYSLIYAIALKCDTDKLPPSTKKSIRKWRFFECLDKRYVYSFSIVDFFQNYNLKKKFENTFKCVFKTEIADSLSCMEPDFYAKRFWKFFLMSFAAEQS